MRKIFICLLLVLTLQAWSEQGKEKNIIGIGFPINNTYIKNGEIVYSGIGLSFSTLPFSTGLIGCTTIAIPIYIIADGAKIDSSGLITDLIIGFGKRHEFIIFKNRPEAKGIIAIGIGLHMNMLNIFDRFGSMHLLNFGPGGMIATGNTSSKVRGLFGLHYDFINYATGNILGNDIKVDVSKNIGGSVHLGFEL